MDASEITLRPARDEDEPALRAIDLLTRSPLNSPAPDPGAGLNVFAGRAGREGIIVAELEGAPVGFVGLAPPTELASNAHVLQISDLAVAPELQRRGIGRALVEAAIERARERGAVKLSLRVLATNPAARALYERAGFKPEGLLEREFRLAGEYVDDIPMAIRLD